MKIIVKQEEMQVVEMVARAPLKKVKLQLRNLLVASSNYSKIC